jgi:hypothetical protein
MLFAFIGAASNEDVSEQTEIQNSKLNLYSDMTNYPIRQTAGTTEIMPGENH